MALKSVVVDRFFARMIEFAQKLQDQHGDLTLAMLDSPYRSGAVTWNLTLSARWLDAMSLRDGATLILEAAARELGELTPLHSGTRILRTDDYQVRTLVPLLNIPELGTAYRVDGVELSMFDLDEVVVLIADPAQLPVTLAELSA